MRRVSNRALASLSALAASCAALLAVLPSCGGKVTPEKTETITFGCFVGECVPPAEDASDRPDAAETDATEVADALDARLDAEPATPD